MMALRDVILPFLVTTLCAKLKIGRNQNKLYSYRFAPLTKETAQLPFTETHQPPMGPDPSTI